MSVDLNTTGGRLKDLGLPGGDADEGPQVNDSLYNESTTGGSDTAGLVDFGVAVAQGAGGDDHCKVVDSNGDVIVGITTRQPLMPGSPPSNLTGWPSKHKLSVKRIGAMYAIPCEDVRKRDQVFAIVAQGGKLAGSKGGPAGTGRLVCPSAIWETTTSAGQVGILRVYDREAPVTTS